MTYFPSMGVNSALDSRHTGVLTRRERRRLDGDTHMRPIGEARSADPFELPIAHDVQSDKLIRSACGSNQVRPGKPQVSNTVTTMKRLQQHCQSVTPGLSAELC